MNPETRFSSHWVVAQQGTGKTTLLEQMASADIQTGNSCIFMDSKGDLTDAIRHLALGERLIVLDPEEPFAINPLDVPKSNVRAAVSQLEYIFSALLGTSITPMQRSLLRPVLRALIIGHPAPTFQTFQEVIYEGLPRDVLDNIPEDLKRFFDNEWGNYDRTRSEIKWRLQLLSENDLLWQMMSAPRTKFNIAKAMDSGAIVVIDNAQSKLDEDGCTILGRFFIARIWSAATARALRPDSEKRPVYFYIDECQLVLDPMIAKIIDELRSQRIALILAHQRASQIHDSNVRGALENCAIKMMNVGPGDIDYFSKLLDIPVERMKDLPQGHFATNIRWERPDIFKVYKAHLPFRTMTPQEEQHLKQQMKDLYGVQAATTPAKYTIQKQGKHFIIPVTVNGVLLPMELDTGASSVSLSHEAALRLRFLVKHFDYKNKVHTANGEAFTERVTLSEVSIGGIVQKDVTALVCKAGAMNGNLLGMSFLQRLASWEVKGDVLVLRGTAEPPVKEAAAASLTTRVPTGPPVDTRSLPQPQKPTGKKHW